MKNIILTLLFAISLPLSAQSQKSDWKLIQSEEGAHIELASQADIQSEITQNSGTPKIVEVKSLAPNIMAIIYTSGFAGTRVQVEVIQALIYNTESQKFLGDYAYQYKSASSPYTLDQPSWKVEGKSLKISDANTDVDVSIDL